MRRLASVLTRRVTTRAGESAAWVPAVATTSAPATAASVVPFGYAGVDGSAQRVRLGVNGPSLRGFASAPLRHFNSSARTSSDAATELGHALADERKHEVDSYAAPKLVERGPPSPFKLTEEPGNAELVLTRTFGASERITVTVDVEELQSEESYDDDDVGDDEQGDEEEEELPAPISFDFNVKVTRADKPGTLEFLCRTHGDDDCFDITNVSLEDDVKVPEDGLVYAGPVYADLDERVLERFHGFLKERGIDRRFVEWLDEAVVDKEQREYAHWLHRVQKFVAK